MARTYIERNSNEVVWQPDTQVDRFQSGLIRVTRSAVVRTDRADRAFIRDGDILPCNVRTIDGVRVHLDPPRSDNEGGWTTFNVTGYGRTTMQRNVSASSEVASGYAFPIYRVEYVKRKGDAYSASSPVPASVTVRSVTTGATITSNYFYSLSSYEERDFGSLVEVIEVWRWAGA